MAFSSLLSLKPKYNSVAGPESEDDDDIEEATKKLEWKQRQSRLAKFKTRAFSALKSLFSPSAGLPWLIIFILSIALAYSHITRPLDSILVYTPVNHLIEYEEKVFTHQTDTRFIGPVGDPRIDEAWEDLYSAGLALELTEQEAALIPNKTWPITQIPGRYYAALNVFHSLHCLDTIRKVLHPEIYDEAALRSLGHIPHCFDILRESIMCTGDTSVSVWQWIPGDKQAKQMTNTPHTCRNFDRIKDWAEERRMSVVFDDRTDHTSNPLAGVWDEPADSLANQNQVADI